MSPPLPSALDRWSDLGARLCPGPARSRPSARDSGTFAVFLDFDGTLADIVARPEDARLDEERRRRIARLAEVHPVAIVTGRAMADIRRKVGLPTLHYAADHGFHITGPDVEYEVDPTLRDDLALAAAALTAKVGGTPGTVIEAKRYSVALHHRLAAEADVPRLEAAVDEVVAAGDRLRKGLGHKVFEIRPARDWHKGAAVEWLLERFGVATAIYVGDDRTDEDAIARVEARGGVGVIVGDPPWPTAASYRLADPDEVGRLVTALTSLP